MKTGPITVIGAGLAGCEAAWQIAGRGVPVRLYEMRPNQMTPAHTGGRFAELVCSNSLGSNLPDRAPGLLKAELRRLASLILTVADRHAVPAGGALAVDRDGFAQAVTQAVEGQPLITVIREEVAELPADRPLVLAAGPLMSPALTTDASRLTGAGGLAFYDAMAPIVTQDSIDMSVAFRAGRYGQESDYINCPLSEEEYRRFVDALLSAELAPLRGFEAEDRRFFEACLPVEVLARRGEMALAYGPLRPVGLTDPRTGGRPFAVVQLRQDDAAATLYNLVGFQTNLRFGEQDRVFRLIPGLERAEFVRYGQMHRNTFLDSPRLLGADFEMRREPGMFVAGQLTGTEGYVGSTASGWVAGVNAARRLYGRSILSFPPETMIGALSRYISNEELADFQPMKPNFGLLPPLDVRYRKRERYGAYAARAMQALDHFIVQEDLLPKGATA